jgi:hypothetical protein
MVASEECDNGGAQAFTQVMFCCHRPQSESFLCARELTRWGIRTLAALLPFSSDRASPPPPPWTTCALHKVQSAGRALHMQQKCCVRAMGQCWFAPLAHRRTDEMSPTARRFPWAWCVFFFRTSRSPGSRFFLKETALCGCTHTCENRFRVESRQTDSECKQKQSARRPNFARQTFKTIKLNQSQGLSSYS